MILVALALVGMRLGLMLRRRHPRPPAAQGLAFALVGKLLVLPLALRAWPDCWGCPAAAGCGGAAGGGPHRRLGAAAQRGRRGRSGRKRPEAEGAASLVLWSTALALLTVPLWWWLLNGPLRS